MQKKGPLNIQAVLLLSALCSHALAGIHCYHCKEGNCSSIIWPRSCVSLPQPRPPAIPPCLRSFHLYYTGWELTVHLQHIKLEDLCSCLFESQSISSPVQTTSSEYETYSYILFSSVWVRNWSKWDQGHAMTREQQIISSS